MQKQCPEQQLSFYTDNICWNDGRFDERRFNQDENTFAAILTLGDSWTMFQRVFSDSNDNQVGINRDGIN